MLKRGRKGLEWVEDLVRVDFEKFLVRHPIHHKNDFRVINKWHFRCFNRGRCVLLRFKGFLKFRSIMYPHIRWTIMDIDRINNNYWTHGPNLPFYFEEISQQLPHQISQLPDWSHLDDDLLIQYRGRSLLWNSTIRRLLERIYPGFNWEKLIKFCDMGSPDKSRVFMDGFIVAFFGFVERQEDLDGVNVRRLVSNPGGKSLLYCHQESPRVLVMNSYPELNMRFGRVLRGYWKDLEKGYLIERVTKYFNFERKEDWYKLSGDEFALFYGKLVPKKSIVGILKNVYPEEEWESDKFSDKTNKRARQNYLGSKLKELFPGEVILEEQQFRHGKKCFIFDFYIPGRQLVIEYQGQQHYFSVVSWMPVEQQKKRDEEKYKLCERLKLKLIYVPYWWDSSSSGLKEILQTQINPSPI
eukprot:TRINITY_DN4113_c0_g2_i1.p1 TRINITY_DN4113_c0_g2~~TRINITY_DN4113_c0_g2_i1.p1  ORF type:complete len:412 (-),score=107.99 TRINITY_DN4113_c0_g2_i1:1029-2264(-)